MVRVYPITPQSQLKKNSRATVPLNINDLKKAFDCVIMKYSSKKLHNISVRNSEPLWFQDYLTRTKQYVHLNVAISYLKRILFGVPQSSRLNLGVLCFLSSTSMTCPNIPPFILRFLLLPQNWLPLVLISSHCMNLSTETIKVL